MEDSSLTDCPFCALPAERILERNDQAIAVADAFPVSPGHTLVMPRRHLASFFELTKDEILSIHDLLDRVRQRLDASLKPAGYNIGANVGPVSGQTILHVHIHLIPRFPGDVADPFGGVRNTIPGRGRYPFVDSGT